MMSFWFFVLGVPTLALGLFMALKPGAASSALKAFPRASALGFVLTFVAWLWTAHELDVIGIEVFDRFLKAFPGELWILAVVLAYLMCVWMPNLLPIRAVSAIMMLFPASLFPALRLEPSQWRLLPVIYAYIAAIVGMYSMFYPWHARRAIFWIASRTRAVVAFGAVLSAVGALFAVMGTVFLFSGGAQ